MDKWFCWEVIVEDVYGSWQPFYYSSGILIELKNGTQIIISDTRGKKSPNKMKNIWEKIHKITNVGVGIMRRHEPKPNIKFYRTKLRVITLDDIDMIPAISPGMKQKIKKELYAVY